MLIFQGKVCAGANIFFFVKPMSHHVIESLFRKKTFANVSCYRNHINLLNFVKKKSLKRLCCIQPGFLLMHVNCEMLEALRRKKSSFHVERSCW